MPGLVLGTLHVISQLTLPEPMLSRDGLCSGLQMTLRLGEVQSLTQGPAAKLGHEAQS